MTSDPGEVCVQVVDLGLWFHLGCGQMPQERHLREQEMYRIWQGGQLAVILLFQRQRPIRGVAPDSVAKSLGVVGRPDFLCRVDGGLPVTEEVFKDDVRPLGDFQVFRAN
ncbi:MAG: hypothetical protein LBI33_07065 [Propionibacteriaceae bacterium]|nr:hypothetical protein [Propionibacteriaceae bacterium]